MKPLTILFSILLYPSILFASIPSECCSLNKHSPESDVLMESMADLEVDFTLMRLPEDTLYSPTEGNLPEFGSTEGAMEISYDLPIIQNDFVEGYITFFQTVYKDRFQKGLSVSGRYIPMIHETLVELNLPKDLAYLPLIESNFNVHAVSRAKATGPWQFIKSTGRRYGLRINEYIDERRDPVKSTKAAVRYLQDLYKMFDSWLLAMASYNAGENGIKKAINRTQSNDFWELKESGKIPRETRNYIPKFMAATIIAKNPEAYGFSVEYQPPFLYDEVEINKPTSFHTIARAASISVEEIQAYNPELKRKKTPPNYPNYRLKLPPGKREIFLANISSVQGVQSEEPEEPVQTVSPHPDGSYRHRIRRGETIGSISRKYDVSIKRLLIANRLRKNSVIYPGRRLVIPRSGDSLDVPTQSRPHSHRVKRGETIGSISQKYDISVKHLLRANRLHKNSIIHAGRSLIIPQKI